MKTIFRVVLSVGLACGMWLASLFAVHTSEASIVAVLFLYAGSRIGLSCTKPILSTKIMKSVQLC